MDDKKTVDDGVGNDTNVTNRPDVEKTTGREEGRDIGATDQGDGGGNEPIGENEHSAER